MTGPYKSNLIPLTKGVDRFFDYDPVEKIRTVACNTLEVRVPARYTNYGMLNVSDSVETIGLMDMIFDDKYRAGWHCLVTFKSSPSEIDAMTYNGMDYRILRYVRGDKFMISAQVMKNKNVVFAVYVEPITRGFIPYWMTIDDVNVLLDQSSYMCDSKLPIDHALLEAVYAHLMRNAENKFQRYRHTDMKGPMAFVGLRNVMYSPDSTTARLMGSYGFDQGLVASLVDQTDRRQLVEDLFRGVPLEQD